MAQRFVVIRAAIITVSDSTVAGTREDRSGPALAAKAIELGWTVANQLVLPDEQENISTVLRELCDSNEIDIILTTGGTGLAPRDVTPEAVHNIADRPVPGFGELMRAEGLKTTRFAPLSRSGAATRGSTLILYVPGSPKGAVESLVAVAQLIPHAVDLLHGRTDHK
ncbi:MAG: MogA/MoaB family molybdenum cofactor biosynthesis protein [Acidobacteriota bacterium]